MSEGTEATKKITVKIQLPVGVGVGATITTTAMHVTFPGVPDAWSWPRKYRTEEDSYSSTEPIELQISVPPDKVLITASALRQLADLLEQP